jgi:ATP-dependent RNA helicase DeaD
MTFAELDVGPDLVAALARQEITEPTAIQIAALPVLLAGKDAYLNAETGTGKTLAYLLPIFRRLDADQEATRMNWRSRSSASAAILRRMPAGRSVRCC